MDTLGQAKSIPPARHSHHFVQITAAIAALAGLLFGFDTGVISGAILDIFAVCSPFVGWSLALLSFRPRDQGSATRTDRARFAARAAVAGSGNRV